MGDECELAGFSSATTLHVRAGDSCDLATDLPPTPDVIKKKINQIQNMKTRFGKCLMLDSPSLHFNGR